jgi:hypothetical protein
MESFPWIRNAKLAGIGSRLQMAMQVPVKTGIVNSQSLLLSNDQATPIVSKAGRTPDQIRGVVDGSRYRSKRCTAGLVGSFEST